MSDGDWTYDRKGGIHELQPDCMATVEKVGETYQWAVYDPPLNGSGALPTLQTAKQAAYNRLHKPEAPVYRCYWCDASMPCTVEWHGSFWSISFPGAIQLKSIVGHAYIAFQTIRVCRACAVATSTNP